MFLPFRYTPRHLSTSQLIYAGHSKWANIKQTKGANDAAKSKIFQKATQVSKHFETLLLVYEIKQDILVATRSGGVDPDKNHALAAVLKRLKAQDVPKENIAKALAKAAKVKSSGDTSTYEAMACNSVGIMIECATSNANRTVQTLREILNARGARMAPVGFMFSRNGLVTVGLDSKGSERFDAVAEMALMNGAQDFEELPGESDSTQPQLQFFCEPSALSELMSQLEKEPDVSVVGSELIYQPLEKTSLSEEDSEILQDLIQILEAHEDVVRITHSAVDR
ncbi:hypothetical protein GYMLUDRAFT_261677 [Collybiopsis luxurians FD-317 M1]|uniref:Transcriptional regulatory protein n=1 Tax=Collybiopsis luxurians FD-317 M1 TaxID=944289 RepID=A0A0D0BVT2_9AGAR|nr:hypothetical protein GYMLUDRAFT_261677 [Collybiopsis luxurians FD-317 M1]